MIAIRYMHSNAIVLLIKAVNTIQLADQWTIANSLELLTRTPFRYSLSISMATDACIYHTELAIAAVIVYYSIITTGFEVITHQ